MKALVLALALAAPISASAVPTSPRSLETRETSNSTLAKRANWTFNCYNAGQACRGTGSTSGGGSGTAGCSPISASGCTQYSYDGAGDWLLCVYNEPNCAGEVVASVNGGKVTCLEIENASGYLIGNADEGC